MDDLCAYGGDHPAEKYSSGTPICWAHWRWVKLDLPAANHWAKVAEGFLSNVDYYDLMNFFPAAGVSQSDAHIMLESARKIRAYSKRTQAGLVPPEGPVCAACGDDRDDCLRADAFHQVTV